MPVEVGTPIRGDILAVYSGTAPIEALAEADVIAKVSGESAYRQVSLDRRPVVSCSNQSFGIIFKNEE